MTVWFPSATFTRTTSCFSPRLAAEALVGDAVTGRGPHGTDAVVRRRRCRRRATVRWCRRRRRARAPASSSPPLYANVEPSGDHVRCRGFDGAELAELAGRHGVDGDRRGQRSAARFVPTSPAIASWSVPGRHSRSMGRRSGRRRIAPVCVSTTHTSPVPPKATHRPSGAQIAHGWGSKPSRTSKPSRAITVGAPAAPSGPTGTITSSASLDVVSSEPVTRPNNSRVPSGDHVGHASSAVSDPATSSRRASSPGRTR